MRDKTFENAAITYWTMGLSIFPCAPKSKKPIKNFSWKVYQEVPPTLEQIYEWAEKWPNANVAIVTGNVSGLVVVDIDGAIGMKFPEKFGWSLNTPFVSTSRYGHYYFKYPDFELRNASYKNLGLDIRADGGYVLAPPSIHPDGTVYKWQEPPFLNLPAFPDDLVSTLGIEREHDQPDYMLNKKKGYKSKLRKLKSKASEYAAISNWLKTPRPKDRSGHDFKLVRLCIEHGITSDEDLAQILLNNKYGKTKAYKNPKKYMADLITEAKSKGGYRQRLYSLSDLSTMKFPENSAIIGGGVLNSKSTLILGGEGRIGKTMLYLDLAIRLAYGHSFLGLSTAKVEGVLLLQTENILPAIQDRVNKLKIGHKLNDLPENIYVSDLGRSYNLKKKEHRREIIRLINQTKAELVVLDPFIDFFKVNENDNVEMRGVLRCINKIKAETGTAFILVHHFTKSTGERTDGRNRLRGASAIFDAVDTVLELTGKTNSTERILRFAKLRNAADRSDVYLKRDANLVHHAMSDGTKCPPEKAMEVLRDDLKGRCSTKAELINAICGRGICGDSTAKKGIQKAIEAGMIKEAASDNGTGLIVTNR